MTPGPDAPRRPDAAALPGGSPPSGSSAAGLRARAGAVSAHLPALVLSAERLAAMIAPGAHGLRRAGPGEDFWQYRPASAGDTARSIDWRRSARSDARFVRDREAQTAQSALIWIASGQGMQYRGAAARPTKAERAQVLGLALSMVLLRGGEKAALLGQPPRAGRAQADRIAYQIAGAVTGTGDHDWPRVDALRPGQRVVVLGDFLGDPAWLGPFLGRAAALGIGGVLMQVLDPDEMAFPFDGAVLFRSASGAQRHDSRDAGGLRDAYLARLAERRDLLTRAAAGAGWQLGLHVTDQPPAQALGWLYRALGG